MNAMPPHRARAIAIWWSETDCMIAEANGMLSRIEGRSPLRNRTRGVVRRTAALVFSCRVRFGMRRYSLKVWEGSA